MEENKLKKFLSDNKITLTMLHKRILRLNEDISYNTVVNIVNKKTEPLMGNMRLIANALDVSLDDIV